MLDIKLSIRETYSKIFKRKNLPLYASMLLLNGLLVSCSCSSDDSSSSATTVVIDSSVPSIMQVGETAEGTVALSSTVTSLTSVDTNDVREITIADTSSCNPKLTIFPDSLMVTVDGDAEVFNITAPAGNCLHTVTFSGTGVSTSTNTSDVNVITDQAVVTVGLYDTEGAETATVVQGGTLYVKFTPPADWEGVTTEQSYTVSTATDGITITGSPCSLTPPTTNVCQVTITIAEDLAADEDYTLTFSQQSGTDVPLDISSIDFTVESAGTPATAYITNFGSGDVDKCSFENNDLSECDNADEDGGSIANAESITNAEINGSYYLYIVAPGDGSISSCKLNGEGVFSTADVGGSCSNSVIPDVEDEIRDIAVQKVSDNYYAYITDYGSAVIVCDVSSEAGAILVDECDTFDGGLDSPEGIATAPVGNNATAYVGDNGDNKLRYCPINVVGGLEMDTPCSDNAASGDVQVPIAVAVQEIEDNWYVFVTSEDDDIYTCTVSPVNGSITNCQANNIPANIADPSGIAVHQIDEQYYAYVTNNDAGNNTVTRCLITQATGLIENGCEEAGDGFDSPYGITIIDLP